MLRRVLHGARTPVMPPPFPLRRVARRPVWRSTRPGKGDYRKFLDVTQSEFASGQSARPEERFTHGCRGSLLRMRKEVMPAMASSLT
jgi:hypothetical protein